MTFNFEPLTVQAAVRHFNPLTVQAAVRHVVTFNFEPLTVQVSVRHFNPLKVQAVVRHVVTFKFEPLTVQVSVRNVVTFKLEPVTAQCLSSDYQCLSFSWLDVITIYSAKKGKKACTQLFLPFTLSKGIFTRHPPPSLVQPRLFCRGEMRTEGWRFQGILSYIRIIWLVPFYFHICK